MAGAVVAFRSLTTNVKRESSTNGSGESSNSPIQDSRNLAAQRASSTFDVRHKLAISGTFELPFGKGRHWLSTPIPSVQWLAGGWRINTIGTFLTGLPFTPTMQTNNLNTGTGSQFPNRIAPGDLPSGVRSIDRWFCVLLAPGLCAQESTARLLGTVTDPTRSRRTRGQRRGPQYGYGTDAQDGRQ